MKLFSSAYSFFLLLFLLPLFSTAQIDQGRWLTGGSLQHINRGVENNEPQSVTALNLELGYLLTRRVAVGAGLSIDLMRHNATSGHAIWSRYYMLNLPKLAPFTGLRWTKEVRRLQRTQSREPSKLETDRLFWLLGFNYTIHKNLSVEGIYHFGIFRYIRNETNSAFDEGDTFLDFRLRLLLDSDQQVELLDANSIFSSGKWMIGGFAEFNPIKAESPRRFLEMNIRPFAARFFLKRLLVGGHLNLNYARDFDDITTGLLPFVRYYLPTGGNKALFAEGSYGYNHILKQEEQGLYISDHQFVRQLGLGYAIFVNAQVSLDIMLSQVNTRRLFNFSSLSGLDDYSSESNEFLFSMGLQFFLNP